MRLHPHEFIRRTLMHVLPKGFHPVRHYGLFANRSGPLRDRWFADSPLEQAGFEL